MRQKYKFLVVPLLVTLLLAGCFGKKKSKQPQAGSSAEPDRLLYERALQDIRKGRQGIGRLTLQTLINTYPDSEYLAKAKLAIADSYYKEGGTAGLKQSIAEYKDFITFFPFLDEAAYAQMQVGLAHFRMMEKPDRDRTDGRLAEEEFQIFLQKYPQSKLAPEAEQRLREVQEVLAEGDYRIARFYYIKRSHRAAASRLIELTNRYPLYSQADRALWMLGNIFERSEKSDVAAQYYSRIVREYPLSGLGDDAKARLTKLGVPIPQPDPVALARMQKEREFEHRPGFLKRASHGVLMTRPDVSMAAHTGQPNLAPPSEAAASTETLVPGGKSTVGTAGAGGGGSGGNTAVVMTVTPGSPGSSQPAESSSATPPPAAGSENPPKADSASPGTKPEDPKASDKTKPDDPNKDKKNDPKKESTSKKKKGLRKIIPW